MPGAHVNRVAVDPGTGGKAEGSQAAAGAEHFDAVDAGLVDREIEVIPPDGRDGPAIAEEAVDRLLPAMLGAEADPISQIDLDATGFRFHAFSEGHEATMGEEIYLGDGVRFCA